jgi:hypothetical protein
MENYLANSKKYNKMLYKYMGYDGKDVDYKDFCPHDPTLGFEILRWMFHKINHNPKEGYKMKVILTMRDDESEVFIQQWHDTSKRDGYINIVHCKEVCELKKEEVSKEIYHDAILQVSHRAAYNACVDYLIKTT